MNNPTPTSEPWTAKLITELATKNPTFWPDVLADRHNAALAAERQTLELANAATQHWQRRFERKREQLATAVEALRECVEELGGMGAVDGIGDPCEADPDVIERAKAALAKIGGN